MKPERKKLQPSWENEPSYNDLNNDVSASMGIQESIRDRLAEYKLIKDGGKEIITEPGRSNIRPKVVRKYQEWKYPAIEEPFLNTPNMFQVTPRGQKDSLSSKQAGQILNYQYDILLDKVNLVGSIVRNFVDEGTVVVKTGWEVEYDYVDVEKERPVYASAEESLAIISESVQNGKMSQEEAQSMISAGKPVQVGTEKYIDQEEVIVKNQPTHQILDNANVGIDPKCEGDLTKAEFVWHEYDVSYADLIKNKYTEHEDGTVSGYYVNIEDAMAADGDPANYDNKSPDYNDFEFSDRARKKRKAIEYWGYWDIQGDGVLVPIVAEWINGVLVRLEENPFPHKRLPFSLAKYMPVRGEAFGEPDAKLLEDNQLTIGKYSRAMLDITSTAAVGQEFIDANLFPTNADKQQYDKRKTVYTTPGVDPRRAIYRRAVDPIDPNVFNIIQAATNEAENLSGTKPFSGMNGAQGLGVAKLSLDATAKRELSVLRRLSAMFVDMARMVVSMNQAYLRDEEVVRITDSEFVSIRREDIQGEFDLRISISTPEKDDQQAQSLIMLLQTNAASMDPELYKIVMGKILRLQYHPDLAEKVENFKPEPDPMQQELQKLQLENARLENEKLKSEMISIQSMVNERNSRMIENDADVNNKIAQAELRLAQAEMNAALAEKYRSESDEIDRDFLAKTDGSLERKELDNATLKNAELRIKEQELAIKKDNLEREKLKDIDTLIEKNLDREHNIFSSLGKNNGTK